MSLLEEGVHVREKGEADGHGGLRCRRHTAPNIRLLRNGTECIVVTVEGEESAELHPAIAEFFVGVSVEATSIAKIVVSKTVMERCRIGSLTRQT